MLRELNYYISLAKEMIANDKDRDLMIYEFRKILALQWNAPAELKAFDWWRDFVNSAPADGMDAAVRTFSTVSPTLRIMPRLANHPSRQMADDAEDALMFHFLKANQRAERPPLEKIVDSILKLGAVGIQVQYLPYTFKNTLALPDVPENRSKLNKIARYRRQGDFVYTVHEADTVHARFSSYGMEGVLLAKVMTARELVNELGDAEDEKSAKNAIIKAVVGDAKTDELLDGYNLTFFDYTDDDNRVKWVSMTNSTIIDQTGGTGHAIEIRRIPHKLPFIPWVYRETRKPMLKPIVQSRSWENQNIKESLQYALLVATVAQARTISYTMDGRGVDIVYDNPGGQATAMVGEKVDNFNPTATDPQLEAQIRSGEARITQQLATRALQAAEEVAGTAPYATFNAIMQAAISSLSSHQSAGNGALEDMFYNSLEWIDFTGIPLKGQRPRSRTGSDIDPMRMKGVQVGIGGEGMARLDPNDVLIVAKLRPNTPSDRQQRMNEAMLLHDKFPIAWEEALEIAGVDDINTDVQAWLKERFTLATAEGETKQILGAADLKLQAEGMKLQMAMEQQKMAMAQEAQAAQNQPEPPPDATSDGASNNNAEIAMENANMNDPSQGGPPPAMMAPGQLSQEAISGQSQSGMGGA